MKIPGEIYIRETGRFLPPARRVDSISEDGATPQNIARVGYQHFTESVDIPATVMAEKAVREALSRSDCAPDAISAVILATFDETEHMAPVCYLQRVLGIPGALAFELGAASNGGAMGLEVGATWLAGTPGADAALVCAAGRYPSPRWGRWNPGLFMGDGAAAVVLSRSHGIARMVAVRYRSIPDLEVFALGQVDAGGRLLLSGMDSGFWPHLRTIAAEVKEVVFQLLEENATEISKITAFAITGMGLPTTSLTILDPLDIPLEKTSWPFLRNTGHVGPCDQLLGLDYILHETAVSKGDKILVIGVGLGFRIICILLEVC